MSELERSRYFTRVNSPFIVGAPLPGASLGAALLPATASTLDIMRAEIGKLVILTSDSVVPVTLQIPRRSYLDFHSDLYPPSPFYQNPVLSAESWLQGSEQSVRKASPQPGKQWGTLAQTPAISGIPKANHTDSMVQRENQSVPKIVALPRSSTHPEEHAQPSKELPVDAEHSITSVGETEELAKPLSISSAVPVHAGFSDTLSPANSRIRPSKEPVQPPVVLSVEASRSSVKITPKTESHWSRSFLVGKTALKPDYDDVHGTASTVGASVQLLKVSV